MSPAPVIEVEVNGQTHELPGGTTVEAVVATLAESRSGIAVAVNGSVVPRSAWVATAVVAGDRIEVLTAAQGG